MSVYDLYQSYLNQISNVNQNQTPGITDPNLLLYLQQQQQSNGDGGGDGFTDTTTTNTGPRGITGFDSLGNPISNYTSPMSAVKNIGSFMLNPLGYMGYQGYQEFKNRQAAQQLQNFYNTTEAKTVQDMARDNKASNTGGYQAGYGGGFMDGPSGAGRGNAPSDRGGSDSMGSFAKGGIVGLL